jgi:hypothetical protein
MASILTLTFLPLKINLDKEIVKPQICLFKIMTGTNLGYDNDSYKFGPFAQSSSLICADSFTYFLKPLTHQLVHGLR